VRTILLSVAALLGAVGGWGWTGEEAGAPAGALQVGDEKDFMAVWHGFQGEEVFPKVFAARVGPDGSRSEPVALTDGATPRIAWNGREHLVAYSMNRGKRWLRMDTSGKALWNPSTRSWIDSIEGDPLCSACGLSGDKGWLIVYHGGLPNWWYRSVAIQRVARITPEGKKEAPGDTSGNCGPKGGVPPENWLDTSLGKKTQANVGGSANTPSVFPYGGSALAADGQSCAVEVLGGLRDCGAHQP